MADIYSRRSFVSRLGLFCCALPLTARGQQVQPSSVRRIGFLSGAVPSLITAFEKELRRLGFVDGENLVIEKRISRPNTSDLVVQASEFAHMNLDLIVANAWEDGEYKALREWLSDYGRKVEPLSRNDRYGAAVRVVS